MRNRPFFGRSFAYPRPSPIKYNYSAALMSDGVLTTGFIYYSADLLMIDFSQGSVDEFLV